MCRQRRDVRLQLELDRRSVADRRVPPTRVVEAVDVVLDRRDGSSVRRVGLVLGQLAFDRRPEALGDSVVPTMTRQSRSKRAAITVDRGATPSGVARFVPSALFAVVILSEDPATAASQDFQIWTPLYLTASFTDRLVGWYEVQPRLGANASEVDQLLLRTAVGYRFGERWSAWMGYAWTPSFLPSYRSENRLYQHRPPGEPHVLLVLGQLKSRAEIEKRAPTSASPRT